MAHAENEVVINKPTNVVYDFLADGLNNPKWRPGVIDISLSSGQPGQVGTIYKQNLKGPGGRSISGDIKITEAVPGKALSFQVISGPARPTGQYTLTEVPEGTKLKFALDYKLKGLMIF